MMEDPACEALEDGHRTFEIGRCTADHDRQLTATCRPDAARHRPVEDAGAPGQDGIGDGPDRVGQDRAAVDRDRPGPDAGGDTVRAIEQGSNRIVVSHHRDRDVGGRGGRRRTGRHGRPDPVGQRRRSFR